MRNKIVAVLGAIAIVIVTLPLLGAFEAHIINVTAQIENSVECIVVGDPIDFGTVFPQEKLDRTFTIELSQTFINSEEHDLLEYAIEQEPKCWDGNDADPTFGEVEIIGGNEYVCEDNGFEILPLLCPYLSKSEITDDGSEGENDGPSIPAFHGVIDIPNWTPAIASSTATNGVLQKSVNDIDDMWNVDLKVPCFEEHCAQDWEDFVFGINPEANPDDYIQPIENEHALFGCNVLVVVTGKPATTTDGCLENIDMMLVLDRSGSISSSELAILKNAANSFVTALAPSTDGVHIGQTSFSTNGTLDLHLSDDETVIHAAINALVRGGLTNLFEGIDLATDELDDAHEHERAAIPDIMVIITDGAPNEPGSDANAQAVAATAADDARAAGIEIFVVGVGVLPATETYLKNNIADDAAHYFPSADFGDLEAILVGLAQCEE